MDMVTDREQLHELLNSRPDDRALSVERRPLTRSKQGTWSPGSAIYALAEAHAADGHRLFEAVADVPADR
jgi:hypothetical protein